eukprot:494054_1
MANPEFDCLCEIEKHLQSASNDQSRLCLKSCVHFLVSSDYRDLKTELLRCHVIQLLFEIAPERSDLGDILSFLLKDDAVVSSTISKLKHSNPLVSFSNSKCLALILWRIIHFRENTDAVQFINRILEGLVKNLLSETSTNIADGFKYSCLNVFMILLVRCETNFGDSISSHGSWSRKVVDSLWSILRDSSPRMIKTLDENIFPTALPRLLMVLTKVLKLSIQFKCDDNFNVDNIIAQR